MKTAIFPADDLDQEVVGPQPDRLLFVGDVAVAGYGVLHHGMTAPANAARLVARTRGRGCRWWTIQATDLTVARAAAMDELQANEVDVAVLMMGVPDVLLATSEPDWSTCLQGVVRRIRDRSGAGCVIVFAAIPPMGDFRRIPRVARKLLTLQIDRLNRAMQVIAAKTPNSAFLAFPRWRVGELFVEERFSWKTLHEMWGAALATAIATAIEVSESSRDGAPDSGSRGREVE